MTIVDIAKESGYSISTVSRVLNNRRDVSPAAKERIMQIVRERNFVPNNNAKQLKQTVTKNVLILVKGTSNMLFANIIEVIQQTVEATEYTASIYYIDEYEDEVLEAVRLCRERKPIGIIFLGGNVKSFEAYFGEVSVPCVLVTNSGEKLGYEKLASVATDDFKAAEQAVDYLIAEGHRDIGVLGGDEEISEISRQRLSGCKNSFAKNNLTFNQTDYYEKTRFSFEGGYDAMTRLLDKELPITAVFAMSDVMAIGAIRAIRDRGLTVPGDISVVGFDGTKLADFYNPKIVTVGQGFEPIARKSVESLFHMIELGMKATHELVPFSLKNTESVRAI